MQMLNSKVAAFSWTRPFTSVRPAIHRRHAVRSSMRESRHHGHAGSRTQQPPKHVLFTGWSYANKSRSHSLVRAQVATDPLVPLGLDFLTFLAATVLVIPLFKSVKASPVLGFLFSGLLLGQLGYSLLFVAHDLLLTDVCRVSDIAHIAMCRLFRNIEDIQKLSELGVLFLLFEMGLELSVDRLKASISTSSRQHVSVHHTTKDSSSGLLLSFVTCRHWQSMPLVWERCRWCCAH